MKIGSICRMATWSLSGKLEVFMSMFEVFFTYAIVMESVYQHPETTDILRE